jgi:hypothetical protein
MIIQYELDRIRLGSIENRSCLEKLSHAFPPDDPTLCSDSDSCSMSSISMDDKDSVAETMLFTRQVPRSIFMDYWNRIGVSAYHLRTPPYIVHSRSFSSSEAKSTPDESCFDYHSTAKASSSARRRIFATSVSEPILTQIVHTNGKGMRHTQSGSVLENGKAMKTRSCLRKSKFCVGGVILSGCLSSLSTSVSFNDEVTVVHFEIPKEVYGHEGWSDYFM